MYFSDIICLAQEICVELPFIEWKNSPLAENTPDEYKAILLVLNPLLTDVLSLDKTSLRKIAQRKRSVSIDLCYDVSESLPEEEIISWVKHFPERKKPFEIRSFTRTRCETRFFCCKEILHVFCGNVTDEPSTVAVLEKCCQSWRCNIHKDAELDIETAGIYLAMEVMLSWLHREKQITQLRYAAEVYNVDFKALVAHAYKIPHWVVNHFFDCDVYIPEPFPPINDDGTVKTELDMPYYNFSCRKNYQQERETAEAAAEK